MTLDERLSLLWEKFQKLTPEEIDKALEEAGAPLKEEKALLSTEIVSNPVDMMITDFKSEESVTQIIPTTTTEGRGSMPHEGGIVSNNLRAA